MWPIYMAATVYIVGAFMGETFKTCKHLAINYIYKKFFLEAIHYSLRRLADLIKSEKSSHKQSVLVSIGHLVNS